MDEKRGRIGNLTAVTLIALALIFDAGQFLFTLVGIIPLVGVVGIVLALVLTLCAFVSITLVIFLAGVPLFSGTHASAKLASLIAPLVIELIPFLAAIPAITPGVIAFLIVTRMEEREDNPGIVGNELYAFSSQQQKQRVGLAARTQQRRAAIGSGRGAEQKLEKVDREEAREKQRITAQNVTALRRAYDGSSRKAAPGMLAERAPTEEGLSGFTDELTRYDQQPQYPRTRK